MQQEAKIVEEQQSSVSPITTPKAGELVERSEDRPSPAETHGDACQRTHKK